MTICEINEYFLYKKGYRNIKHLLSNIIGSYIIFETHKQNLYANKKRNFADLDLFYHSANALFLQLRTFLNPHEKGAGFWILIQIASFNLQMFIDDLKKRNAPCFECIEHYIYIETILKELKEIKKQFDDKQGQYYVIYNLIKNYETLEFHLDNTPEKDLANDHYLEKFVKPKSLGVLCRVDEILQLVDLVAHYSEQYATCVDGGLWGHSISIESDISGYVMRIHNRIGRKGTKANNITKIINKNLPKTLKYLNWQQKDRSRSYGSCIDSNDEHNSPLAFDKKSTTEQDMIVEWCKDGFIKIKSINNRVTSYGLKHYYERCDHFSYLGNGELKGAMLKAGFRYLDKNELNWTFNISTKSPALFFDHYQNNNKIEISTCDWKEGYKEKMFHYVTKYLSSKFEIIDKKIIKK